ncbi:Kynurenine aminotransferase [Komagataella phaffii CBS 7435]|nr:Kynurenine aminotransferase [Komagataella phaffii CBS 7435]CCA39004.1 Kynurenine aminotransferase [Komagataella phaffii CBS 7435]
MSSLPKHNPYFQIGGKDIWSLVNETAASRESLTGKKTVNLGQGFFSYSPPPFAIQAAKEALDVPAFNQYAPPRGRPELIGSLIEAYSSYYPEKLTPSQIMVSTGANEGMLSMFLAFLTPGDEVVVFEPFFDQYISNIEIPGGKVVYVPLHPPQCFDQETVNSSDWKINFTELENSINERTKMIVLNTPHNPIGKVFSRDELQRIGDICVRNNIIILADEVYENLYYKEHIKMATLSPEISRLTVTVGSAGKSFAATGWRIGWLIGHKDLISVACLAHTRICFASPSPLQIACASALRTAKSVGYFEETRKQYTYKYKILTDVFDKLGLPYTIAEGGYFLLVNFKKLKFPDSVEFPEEIQNKPRDFKLCYWLIQEFGVVSIPPTEFFIEEHKMVVKDCLRFAVCKDDQMLREAARCLERLKDYIQY